MSDRYAVIGNPVAHSKSPQIHAAFAHSVGADMTYERLLAPLGGFVATVEAFRHDGGRGLNVTVPFKVEAFALASLHSSRAQLAGAVNTLMLEPDGRWYGDNTDGAGLVRDLTENLGLELRDRSILVLGAGARPAASSARCSTACRARSRCATGRTRRRRRSPRSSRRSARSRRSPPRRSPGTASTSWSTRPASAWRPTPTTGRRRCSRPTRSPTTWSTPTSPRSSCAGPRSTARPAPPMASAC